MPKLTEYRRKRHLDRTPEPAGKQTDLPKDGTFVVQKHAARRLHYDFRLAVGGALKSWAVPKGPSLNPGDKRLAVQTEDHPLEYADFEGKIPEGNYGAGTVMVWDRGTFTAEGDLSPAKQLERGEIKFSLNGEKLRGSFVLVKLKNSEKGNEWLMIKHKDAAEDPAWDVDAHDGSVLSGRTLEEIKEETPPKREASPVRPAELEGARKSAIPHRVVPILATLTDHPFSDPDWLFEIKWDGVRALAWIEDGSWTLRSRASRDITSQYPELASVPEHFAAKQAILDGEIVALDSRGHSDFGRLQQRMHVQNPSSKLVSDIPVAYFLFDLLYCDGYDLRQTPLLQRKQLLQRLLHPSEKVRYSDHQPEHGKELFELAKENGLEGIVAKRIDSLYTSGRSSSWAKLKTSQTLDAIVGGWTVPRGGGLSFGSLLLGLYDENRLRFIGHAGSGFDGKMQKEIFAQLREHAVAKCPFAAIPETNEKAFWAAPDLVARVRFSGWTQERRLRHPVFVGLREDANPEDCRWDTEAVPVATPALVRSPSPDLIGTVLSAEDEIEAELFGGRRENVLIELQGKRMRLSHLNKVYFPESGYTKRNLLAYYYRVAEYILPFLRDRPLVLRRYPDGIQGQAFFQKDMREGLPDWFKTVPVQSEGKNEVIHYGTANDLPSLIYLTSLGCIDHNPWSSRISDFEHPDYFFFDLDPTEGTDFSVALTIARALHAKLQELGLHVFLKTSGATGFHLYVPVEPVYTYEQLRTFGEIVARLVTRQHPRLVTNERSIAKRPKGRVLIDVQQNSLGRPLASAYSVRAFPKAPVSTPVSPKELKSNLQPVNLNIKSVLPRIEKQRDLWADFWKRQQRLESAIEVLSGDVGPESGASR